jgi:hypothetical protein
MPPGLLRMERCKLKAKQEDMSSVVSTKGEAEGEAGGL